jgi:adenosine deaminase/aminodeoxyfutalosine deaminase
MRLLWQFMDLLTLDKAELHVHLEGSIVPQTLLEIEPALSIDEILARYRYDDFAGFLAAFKWVNSFLTTPRHFALITRRLIDALVAQGVSYAEINVSAGVLLLRQLSVDEIFPAIAAEAARGPIQVRFIFDAVRQFGVDHVWATAREAVRHKGLGVVAFGVGGDEVNGPIQEFREVFDYARSAGLRFAPHAGETAGPESVWAALECGADRIGHGIRSIGDPVLVRHLRDHRVPLEVCISSNVCTGVVASLQDHPVRKLFEAGVPIVLNTDDPPMFHTTLLDEYSLAARHFGFADDDLRQIAANSLRYSFKPPG